MSKHLKTSTSSDSQSESGLKSKRPDDDRCLNLALVIFARNEEDNIGRFLVSLTTQTLFVRKNIEATVYVVANGCTDQTAQIARESASQALHTRGIKSQILDWATPGKSRSWNRVVHELLPTSVDYIIALDADIQFVDANVLAAMFDCIRGNPKVEVVSGFPVKDITHKVRPTLIDRFSMSISGSTRHSGAINGSLYLATAARLREIWLPDDTPGEDGFLNAMATTRGFSRPEQHDVVLQMSEPTHYFESHSPVNFFVHETRMIVGTMINRWIFEYLHSLKLADPAGPMIDRLNREEPDWVEKIIAERSAGKWLIPRALLFRRLTPKQGLTASYLIRLPIFALATALTLPPAITANKALKKRGASSIW